MWPAATTQSKKRRRSACLHPIHVVHFNTTRRKRRLLEILAFRNTCYLPGSSSRAAVGTLNHSIPAHQTIKPYLTCASNAHLSRARRMSSNFNKDMFPNSAEVSFDGVLHAGKKKVAQYMSTTHLGPPLQVAGVDSIVPQPRRPRFQVPSTATQQQSLCLQSVQPTLLSAHGLQLDYPLPSQSQHELVDHQKHRACTSQVLPSYPTAGQSSYHSPVSTAGNLQHLDTCSCEAGVQAPHHEAPLPIRAQQRRRRIKKMAWQTLQEERSMEQGPHSQQQDSIVQPNSKQKPQLGGNEQWPQSSGSMGPVGNGVAQEQRTGLKDGVLYPSLNMQLNPTEGMDPAEKCTDSLQQFRQQQGLKWRSRRSGQSNPQKDVEGMSQQHYTQDQAGEALDTTQRSLSQLQICDQAHHRHPLSGASARSHAAVEPTPTVPTAPAAAELARTAEPVATIAACMQVDRHVTTQSASQEVSGKCTSSGHEEEPDADPDMSSKDKDKDREMAEHPPGIRPLTLGPRKEAGRKEAGRQSHTAAAREPTMEPGRKSQAAAASEAEPKDSRHHAQQQDEQGQVKGCEPGVSQKDEQGQAKGSGQGVSQKPQTTVREKGDAPGTARRTGAAGQEVDVAASSRGQTLQSFKKRQERVQDMLNSTPASKVVAELKVGRAIHQVTAGDLRRLALPEMLNDEVINFYMAFLQVRNDQFHQKAASAPEGASRASRPKVYMFSTFFFAKLMQVGGAGRYNYEQVRRWTRPQRTNTSTHIFDKDLLLFPIHGTLHWTLAAIWVREGTVQYFDSLGGSGGSVLRALESWMFDEAADKQYQLPYRQLCRVSTSEGVPQQADGISCGVFALAFASLLSRGTRPPFPFSMDQIPKIRLGMTESILRAGQGEV